MQISTMSVVVGGTVCNASCPFCVARMTPTNGVPERASEPKWDNFKAALRFAKNSGVSTVLITGKGEPTLYRSHIDETLVKIRNSEFAFIELQTNAIPIAMQSKLEMGSEWSKLLHSWKEMGLTTIAISIVSPHDWRNQQVYTPHGHYPPLFLTIKFLRDHGINVRLSCIMTKGNVDSVKSVQELLAFAKENDAFQVTLIPVTKPAKSEDQEAYDYVSQNNVDSAVAEIRQHLEGYGTKLLEMPHGAVVYDLKGQNVCLSNCLTETSNPDKIRQLIYFTHDGSLRYSWQYAGARLL